MPYLLVRAFDLKYIVLTQLVSLRLFYGEESRQRERRYEPFDGREMQTNTDALCARTGAARGLAFVVPRAQCCFNMQPIMFSAALAYNDFKRFPCRRQQDPPRSLPRKHNKKEKYSERG